MELVSLSELIDLTGLAHRDLCGLLEEGKLRTALGSEGQLLVDISVLPPDVRTYRSTPSAVPVESDLVAQFNEELAAEILHQLDDIVQEAVELAATWLSQEDPQK